MKICFSEEGDTDFIRWTSNLFRTFLNEGSITFVGKNESPDLMVAGIWRPHEFPKGLPVVLISNENWSLFKPKAPYLRYKAVLGIYPPREPCRFIPYPYAAVHFDESVEELYALRTDLLKVQKTRFCCFVVSARYGAFSDRRVALFEEIDRWQRVVSAGKVMNNCNFFAPRGLDFLRWISEFKYMICLENSMAPNYITEKPFQPWFAGTVPIYDGACVKQLNQDAIINASSGDAGDVISQLMELEASPDLYEAKRRAELSGTRLSLANFEEQFRKRFNL